MSLLPAIRSPDLATAVHDWTPSEAAAYPSELPSGVLVSRVEEWNDSAVSMDAVVRKIDPTALNPLVQANAVTSSSGRRPHHK